MIIPNNTMIGFVCFMAGYMMCMLRLFRHKQDEARKRTMTIHTTVQRASGITENVCKHGIGHPTRESAKRVADAHGHHVETWLQHGCDGCCKEWK